MAQTKTSTLANGQHVAISKVRRAQGKLVYATPWERGVITAAPHGKLLGLPFAMSLSIPLAPSNAYTVLQKVLDGDGSRRQLRCYSMPYSASAQNPCAPTVAGVRKGLTSSSRQSGTASTLQYDSPCSLSTTSARSVLQLACRNHLVTVLHHQTHAPSRGCSPTPSHVAPFPHPCLGASHPYRIAAAAQTPLPVRRAAAHLNAPPLPLHPTPPAPSPSPSRAPLPVRIPPLYRRVVERAAHHRLVVPRVCADGLPARQVPQPRRGVAAGGDQVGCVHAEHAVPHPARVAHQRAVKREAVQVPQLDCKGQGYIITIPSTVVLLVHCVLVD